MCSGILYEFGEKSVRAFDVRNRVFNLVLQLFLTDTDAKAI